MMADSLQQPSAPASLAHVAPIAPAASAAPKLSAAHPTHPLTQPGQQITSQCTIRGVPTTVVCTSFADRIFLVVTQIDKLGSITLAQAHQSPAGAGSDAPSYSLSTLLGVRHAPLPQLLARRLIEGLRASPLEHMARKSLLLSLGLKKRPSPTHAPTSDGDMTVSEEDMHTVREIIAAVDAIKQW